MDVNSSVRSLNDTLILPGPTVPNDPYLQLRKTSDVVIGVLSIVLLPCILFGNFLVLISLSKFNFRLRTTTNIFIRSLSLADCCLAVLSLPVYITFYLSNESLVSMKYLCLFKFSSVLGSLSGSLLSLVAIAVDRYIAIIRPLKYPVIMTRKNAQIVVSVLWIYAISLTFVPFFWNNYDKLRECAFYRVIPRPFSIMVVFGVIVCSLTLTMYLYIRIFKVAKQQRERMLRHRAKKDKAQQKQFDKETKSAKTMAVVLFLFYAFWGPFLLIGPLNYIGIAKNLIEMMKNSALLLAMSNSAINPIIYCWMRKDFKQAFKIILHCNRGNKGIYSSKNSMDSSEGNENHESEQANKNVTIRMEEIRTFTCSPSNYGILPGP